MLQVHSRSAHHNGRERGSVPERGNAVSDSNRSTPPPFPHTPSKLRALKLAHNSHLQHRFTYVNQIMTETTQGIIHHSLYTYTTISVMWREYNFIFLHPMLSFGFLFYPKGLFGTLKPVEEQIFIFTLYFVHKVLVRVIAKNFWILKVN